MSRPPTKELVDERGMRWRVESAYADAFTTTILPRLDELSGQPGVDVIKRNRVRTVMRLDLSVDGAPREIYLKRYHAHGPLAVVKGILLRSRARQEWEMAHALEKADVRTAHPIAWAEQRRAGVLVRAAYACLGLAGAIDFVDYLATRAPEPETDTSDALRRRTLLATLSKLTRSMHDGGIDHADLHSGNVLVVPTESHRDVRVHIIDLHKAFLRGYSLSPNRRITRLAKLLHSLVSIADASARYRFVRDYAAGAVFDDLREAVREIERRIVALERRRIASRSKRPFKRTSRFDVAREGGFRVRFLRNFPAARLADAVRVHQRVVADDSDSVQLVKRGKRGAVTRGRIRGSSGEVSVVVKETRPTRFRHWIGGLFGRSRGRNSWFNGHALAVRNMRSAEPYGWLVERRGPFLVREYVVMEDVSMGGERLDHHVLRRFRSGDLSREKLHALIDLTARFVARLHRAGIYHGDLKACNVYVGEDVEGRAALCLIDYDDVTFGRSVSERRRIKNLAQLSASIPRCVSRADRLRFFRIYAGTDAPRWKRKFVEGVDRECATKIVVDMEPIE